MGRRRALVSDVDGDARRGLGPAVRLRHCELDGDLAVGQLGRDEVDNARS